MDISVRLKSDAILTVLAKNKIFAKKSSHESQFVLTEENLLLSPSKLIQQGGDEKAQQSESVINE